MMNISKQLGAHTLIEGVETQEQLDFVQEIDCELVQGYYYYKPEPLEEILYRTGHGGKVGPCETKEEREALEAEWMES